MLFLLEIRAIIIALLSSHHKLRNGIIAVQVILVFGDLAMHARGRNIPTPPRFTSQHIRLRVIKGRKERETDNNTINTGRHQDEHAQTGQQYEGITTKI